MIFNQQDLREAGVMRYSDLFSLLNNWRSLTLDGYNWFSGASGTSAVGEQNWEILLDGVPMEFGISGMKSINMFPLSIDLVDYIEISEKSVLVDGRMVTQGVIYIHTIAPEDDLNVDVRLNIGNETGDPGPYRYTEYSSLNVDKIGPDFAIDVGYNAGNWYFTNSVTFQQHFPTDERIYDRVQALWEEHPKIKTATEGLLFRWTGNRWSHSFTGAYVLDETFRFMEVASREIPFEHLYYQLNWDTSLKILEDWSWNLSINESRNILDEIRILPPDGMLDELLSRSVKLEWNNQTPGYNSLFGLKYNSKKSMGDMGVLDSDVSMLRIYRRQQYPITENIHQDISLSVTVLDEDRIGLAGILETSWTGNRLHAKTGVSAGRILREDMNSYWFPAGMQIQCDCYTVLEISDMMYPELENMAYVSLWGEFGWDLNERLSLSLMLHADDRENIFITNQEIQFDSTDGSTYTWTSGQPDVSAGDVRIDFQISQQIMESFIQRFFVSWLESYRESAEYSFYSATRPKLQLQWRGEYSRPDRLSLWMVVRYQSESSWESYYQIAADSGGLFSGKVKSFTSVDITLQKFLWEKRISTQIVIRNLFSSTQIMHPIGGQQDLSLFVKASVSLN